MLENISTPLTCNFIKKQTMAQIFSCEFFEIFKSSFFTEHLWTTASVVFAILLLLKKRGLTVIQKLLASVILLEFKLLKYGFSHVLKLLHISSLAFCNLSGYTCARLLKFIRHFRHYHDFFPKTFCHETIVVISDIFVYREQI